MTFERLMDLLWQWKYAVDRPSVNEVRAAVVQYGQAEYRRGYSHGERGLDADE